MKMKSPTQRQHISHIDVSLLSSQTSQKHCLFSQSTFPQLPLGSQSAIGWLLKHNFTKIVFIHESSNLPAFNFNGYCSLHILSNFSTKFEIWLTTLSLKHVLSVPDNFLPIFFVLLSIQVRGIYIIDFYKLYILRVLTFCL